MLRAKDGEIEDHDGTRGIDLFFFWCFVWVEAARDACSTE